MKTEQNTSLKALMEEREILAKTLANAVGTDPSTVSRWRNGLTPNKEMRTLISDAMNLSDAERVALGWDEA